MAKEQPKEQPVLIPTAPIGFNVRWLDPARSFRPLPAVVLEEEEEPGSVALVVFSGSANRVVRGVRHVTHPQAQDRQHANTRQYGAWEYMPDTNPPRAHFKKHEYVLVRRAERAEMADRERQQVKEEYDREMAKPRDLSGGEISRIQQQALAAASVQ